MDRPRSDRPVSASADAWKFFQLETELTLDLTRLAQPGAAVLALAKAAAKISRQCIGVERDESGANSGVFTYCRTCGMMYVAGRMMHTDSCPVAATLDALHALLPALLIGADDERSNRAEPLGQYDEPWHVLAGLYEGSQTPVLVSALNEPMAEVPEFAGRRMQPGAILRRIAACINFLAQVDTDVLESDVLELQNVHQRRPISAEGGSAR